MVRTFLKGKGKLSHLDGTGPQQDLQHGMRTLQSCCGCGIPCSLKSAATTFSYQLPRRYGKLFGKHTAGFGFDV